jgi:AcrR family transcriptional regulator
MVAWMEKKDTKTRQAEIVGMAVAIIGELGVSGLTTARLAKRLGMSEPNLYRHFSNKEAILSAVIDDIGAVIMDKAVFIAGQSISPEEKLENIMASHISEVEQRSGIPRLLFSEDMHVRYPQLRDKLIKRIGGYMSTIEKTVEEGKADGTFRKDINAMETARTYLGMVQFAAMRWSISGFAFPLREEGRRLWGNFSKMIKNQGVQ